MMVGTTVGKVTKMVRTFGSHWGRVSPDGETREIFFNSASMVDPADFADLIEGAEVEFEELKDPVNGTRAAEMRKV